MSEPHILFMQMSADFHGRKMKSVYRLYLEKNILLSNERVFLNIHELIQSHNCASETGYWTCNNNETKTRERDLQGSIRPSSSQ